MPGKPVIALVDGHSLFHRAFFALPALATNSGQPTGAIYGFLAMLYRLLDDERPTHLAVAFDPSGPTFRDDLFAEYKAQRPGMPGELLRQLPLLREVLDALRVPTVEVPGFEADDVIGTLATRAAAEGLRVLVVTGDRDAFQLAGPDVSVVYTRRGITDVEKLDEAAIRARYGLAPSQLVDVKALTGDTSDNYPGVPTVGEKTAVKLIREYGSVETLLERLDEVGPPRVRQALREHADRVPRNKRLATIARDAPLAVDPAAYVRREPDADRARAIFTALELRSFLRRLPRAEVEPGPAPEPAAGPAPEPAAGPAPEPAAGPPAGAAASDDGAAPAAGRPPDPARQPDPLDPAVLRGAKEVAVAVLWDLGRQPARIVLAAPGALQAGTPAELGDALDEAPPKVGYDLKPWVRARLKAGGAWRPLAFDAMVAAYLLDAGRSRYPLADLARQYADLHLPDDATPEQQAAAALRLREPMEAELRARGLHDLFAGTEMPLIEVLAAMEVRGVLVDKATLARLGEEFRARIAEKAAAIYALAGEPFNINSTQQLGRILFDKLGLQPPKRTKTGYSTDAEVLEELAAAHELPAHILEHRTLQKLQSTYIDALQALIDPTDGRVHTTFAQTVAATGRLASADPNLQNIPVRDEQGRRIRAAFVAPPGHVLVSADYSQIELRILAHLSQDPALIDAFLAGEDFHRQTAAFVFGVTPAEVTPRQRSAAKATNFGVVYGISDFGLARQLGIGTAEAHEIIERYFARFPRVRAYLDGLIAEARATGQVRTMFGRIRTLPDIASRNRARRSFAERMAMNSPLQGTAADLIKRAMVAAYAELRARGGGAAMVLQVHDELIFEAPEPEAASVAALARRAMTGAAELAVPLVVEARSGRNWYQMEPLP
jgi:DNA polymerase-1